MMNEIKVISKTGELDEETIVEMTEEYTMLWKKSYIVK